MEQSSVTFDISEVAQVCASAFCPTLFFGLSSWALGLLVFRPLYAKGVYVPPNTRFRIFDIIILITQLQIAGSAVLFLIGNWLVSEERELYALALTVCLLVFFWWFTGVRVLAKARVEYAPHRLTFLAVVMPISYMATVGLLFIPLTLSMILYLLSDLISQTVGHSHGLLLYTIILLNAGALAVLFGAYRFSQRIIERAHDDAARRDGIEFGPLNLPRAIVTRTSHPSPTSSQEIRILESPESSPMGD